MTTIIAELAATLGLIPDADAWAKGDTLLAKMSGKLGVLAGAVGAAFAFSSVKGWIDEVADAGAAADDMSQRLGLSASEVMRWTYALEQSDGSIESLSTAFKYLAKKGVKDPEQALMKLADRFASMEDGPKKTKLAIDQLGRGGIALIPFLNNGSKGIKELREEADRLGIVMSDDVASAFEGFGDAQNKLSAAWKGIKTQIVTALLPAMSGLVDKANEWIATHQEEIARAVGVAVEYAAKAFEWIGKAANAFVSALNWVAENSEVVEAALKGIAVILGIMAAESVIAMAPMLALIAAATAIVLAVEDISNAFTGGESKIVNTWKQLWGKIKGTVRPIIDLIALPFLAIRIAVTQAAKAIYNNIGPIINWLVDKIKWLIAKIVWLKDKIVEFWKGTPDAASKFEQTKADFMKRMDPLGLRTVAPQSVVTDSATAADGPTTVQVNAPITVNPSPGMDETDLAAKAADQLQSKISDAYETVRGGYR